MRNEAAQSSNGQQVHSFAPLKVKLRLPSRRSAQDVKALMGKGNIITLSTSQKPSRGSTTASLDHVIYFSDGESPLKLVQTMLDSLQEAGLGVKDQPVHDRPRPVTKRQVKSFLSLAIKPKK